MAWQLRRRRLAYDDKILRLTPSGRFLGATCGHHLAHHGRQHVASLLPADEIQALEGLVDEVERVSVVGKGAIRHSREQEVSERGW